MAWRTYDNLIDGELDNRTPGKVTGWMRFVRNARDPLRVTFDLEGDFHEDIRGTMIRLSNTNPSDPVQGTGTNMEGFDPMQRGTVGDITAGISLGPWTDAIAQKLMATNEQAWDNAGINGSEREKQRREWSERYRAHIVAGDLYYPYVSYPYIEWYSDSNGRVVLELDPSQVEIVKGTSPPNEKTPKELLADDNRRRKAFVNFFGGMCRSFSKKNRRKGGDGNVTGIVVS